MFPFRFLHPSKPHPLFFTFFKKQKQLFQLPSVRMPTRQGRKGCPVPSQMVKRVKCPTIRPRRLHPSLSRTLPSQLAIIIWKDERLRFIKTFLFILSYYLSFLSIYFKGSLPPNTHPHPYSMVRSQRLPPRAISHPFQLVFKKSVKNGKEGFLSILFKGSLKS